MEFRSFSDSPIELRQIGNKMILAGYASVYNKQSRDLGGFVEVIRPGAFDDSLAEIQDGQRDVVARFNHEGGFSTLARTANDSLELRSDSTGLHYVATLPNTSTARDVYEMVRSGLVSKSSFAFTLANQGDKWDFSQSPPVREVLRANLIDVAPVDDPAYLATSVNARAFTDAQVEHYRTILKAMQERNRLQS